jgi:hypothetical protein
MSDFATITDIEALWRTMSSAEKTRAAALIPVVSSALRAEAQKVGKNLDEMIATSEDLARIATSVTVDIISRTLMTSTNQEPMSQMSQSALGYTVSGTFLVPGGGLFIKKSELARLGLKRQKIGVIDLYGAD